MDRTGFGFNLSQVNYTEPIVTQSNIAHMIDWNDPNVLVTTWGDLGLLVLIIGMVCLIAGYLIGRYNKYGDTDE
jgi:hypothetical protein